MQSSANSLVRDVTKSGGSLMDNKYGALRDSAYGGFLRFCSIYDDLLGAACQEGLDPSVCLTPNSIMVDLSQESSMRDVIEGFGKVKNHTVHLPSSIHCLRKFVC